MKPNIDDVCAAFLYFQLARSKARTDYCHNPKEATLKMEELRKQLFKKLDDWNLAEEIDWTNQNEG